LTQVRAATGSKSDVTASSSALDSLLNEVRACRACADALPLGPRPVFQFGSDARLLIASQAPGSKVHRTGRPFSDPSGDRLREWMGVSERVFYDETRIAILPLGHCYPGRIPGAGDAPPRPECARLWRAKFLDHMPAVRLTLLVGSYAQAYALGPGVMTERVRAFRSYLPTYFPLPHPSWRSRHWMANNPWFVEDVLPALRQAISLVLGAGPALDQRVES
jgi:uracil-DNA glycosylase